MTMQSTLVVEKDNTDKIVSAVTRSALLDAARAGGHVIEGAAKINASSGRPGLEMETGALVNSINVVTARSSTLFAEVDIGPTVIYGRIHELGGMIVPVNAPMLAWQDKDTGEYIFANAVHIPARPYMRPAVDENDEKILEAVAAELRRSIGAVM